MLLKTCQAFVHTSTIGNIDFICLLLSLDPVIVTIIIYIIIIRNINLINFLYDNGGMSCDKN